MKTVPQGYFQAPALRILPPHFPQRRSVVHGNDIAKTGSMVASYGRSLLPPQTLAVTNQLAVYLSGL
jgi:hypothetical protein